MRSTSKMLISPHLYVTVWIVISKKVLKDWNLPGLSVVIVKDG